MAGDEGLDRIRPIAERVAESYGLEIFDLQFRRESPGWVLRVILDRPAPSPDTVATAVEEPIGIQECQRVSQDLGAILDVEDPFEHAYTLEVSSPGLDRPLRQADDYRRFRGRLAKIVVSDAIEGRKHFSGRLRDLEKGTVVLEGEGARLYRIPLASIRRARLEVEF